MSFGNCQVVQNYSKGTGTDPQGNTYDMPYTTFGCGGGGGGGVHYYVTVREWDDIHGTGPCRTLDCFKKNVAVGSGPATPNKISAYNPTFLQRIGDKIDSWIIQHEQALDFFSCLAAPGAVNDIADLAAISNGAHFPPADSSDGGSGGGPMWVNTQLNAKNGGYSLSNPPVGATYTNGAALATDWVNSAAPCVGRK
jgi:hypothetical protein